MLLTSTAGKDEKTNGSAPFYECSAINGFSSDRCLGGFNSECAEGHRGPICALCEPKWYQAPPSARSPWASR